MALADREREGADHHQDGHEQRGAAHRAAHADQFDPGGGRVQELDRSTVVARADLCGGSVQRPGHGLPDIGDVRAAVGQHPEGGDLPGVRGQPRGLGGGEEE